MSDTVGINEGGTEDMNDLDDLDGADTEESVAIVGMACRYPGSADVSALWENLKKGTDGISRFALTELTAAGVAESVARHPDYVPARGVLPGGDLFDWSLFGYSPGEAARMDPQQRVFLETAFTALEDAGLDTRRADTWIGVYAGCDTPRADFESDEGLATEMLARDKDFLATRVAYKLGLRGPAMTIQTACSTSLVATHLAVQSLLNHECDAALAGGVSLRLPATGGYLYRSGGIASPDGHCRPFDAAAAGTVPANGVGIVVLKRLSDAERDGDRIIAVLRGSAINNDGNEKIGYTTPSVTGQREVIALAHEQAGITSDDIGYIEAHGTGTAVGDPVELAGLKAAFAETSGVGARPEHCWLGAIKSNIGHTGSAAGIAGVIKTALMLHHRTLVPNAHFDEPTEALADSPFQVCRETRPWAGDGALFAGVSSFGIGGTNAHVVLESPPRKQERVVERAPASPRLLGLSAPTEAGLDRLRNDLAECMAAPDAPRLDDVAWTLATARRRFPLRVAHVVANGAEALDALRDTATTVRAPENPEAARQAGIIMTMPGQSVLRAGSGRAAHALLPRFRASFDRIREEALDRFGIDIATCLDPAADPVWLDDTRNQQVALLALGHAFAEQLAAWDIRPTALLGNSSGEYVAATISGLWDLSDALTVVHARGEAMWEAPEGRMIAVSMTPAEAAELAAEHSGVGVAVDAPGHVIISGRVEAVEVLTATLEQRNIEFTVLRSPLASHSAVMEGAADRMRSVLAGITTHAPRIPIVSNVTGDWLTAEQAADPDYWATHLCTTVQLTKGIGTLLDGPSAVALELGPGDTMSRFLRAHPAWGGDRLAVPTLGRAPAQEETSVLEAVGRLWERGLEPEWADLFTGSAGTRGTTGTPPRRTSLPPIQLDSRPLPPTRRTATPAPTAPTADGPFLLGRPLWTETENQISPPYDALLLLEDVPEPGARQLVDSLCAPDAARHRTNWTEPEAALDALLAGPGQAPAIVAVLPPNEEPGVLEAVARLAQAARERSVPVLLLARHVLNVLSGERPRSDAAGLTAWATGQSRAAAGLVGLLDLGPSDHPLPTNAPRRQANSALYAWRGGRWWRSVAEAITQETSTPHTPKRLAIGADGVPGAAALVRELAARGAEIGAFVPAGSGDRRATLPTAAAELAPAPAWEATDRLSAHPELKASLDRFCAGLVGRFLLSAGGVSPGDSVAADELSRRLDPDARLPRFTGMLLDVPTAEGWLAQVPGQALRLADDFADQVSQALALADGEELAELPGLRRLLEHCVAAFPEVFAGTRTPVSVLYPDGRPDFLRDHMADNRIVVGDSAACLDSLVQAIQALQVDAHRPLSILEAGAGQAGFAERLLTGWEARSHVSYHVTDVSPLLVRRARERYADATNMAFSVYDFTRDPIEQGLAPGTYDLIIAYNSLHVAPDIREAVRNLRRLLSDDGSLCLVEITSPSRWEHLVWGLAPGWWDYEDDLRADSVHLDRESWLTALRDGGFDEVTCLPADGRADHTLLLASGTDSRPRQDTDTVRELVRQADLTDCDALIHLVGPSAAACTAETLGAALTKEDHTRTLVVTVDAPGLDTTDGIRFEQGRRTLDPPLDSSPRWRHVEVPHLNTATLAALPSLATDSTLPPILRLERPGTQSPGPTPPTQPMREAAPPSPPSQPTVAEVRWTDPASMALDEVWRDLLGAPATSEGDDFFALGGDSLMAVHFVSRVRERTGVALPLTAFAESATFGELVALLRAGSPRPAEPVHKKPTTTTKHEPIPDLMPLRSIGTRPPLFLAAPAVGSSLCYRTLAQRLGDDQPCYGIESPLMGEDFAGGARIEDVAAHHVEVILRARPEGPYRIGGWSVGAMVAHEVARQLIEAGHPVDLVLGIDGYAIDTHGRPQYTLPTLLAQGLRYQAQAALGRRPDIQRMGGDQRVYRRAFQRNVRAMLRHVTRPVACDAVVFKAGADEAAIERVRERIGALYEGRVDIHQAPGTHFTILNDPHVGEVAEQLGVRLA
ncbi:beta-ketoacyl synthase N-terminal-like domain-containing protein [Streptomyces europaeiscabiei]|uniref:type I polyketide synthase n=1 Tax=Streptomyces europaeiscabiei TaxID=146819 RepID=UPI0029A7A97E|nr:polyketide synthase [Streptomyces europaeiscabiei]MDX3696410.1 beta-ketoacyl synthase N-terminal-like domain-containing protein [Streptomyces europaeiscabiei]